MKSKKTRTTTHYTVMVEFTMTGPPNFQGHVERATRSMVEDLVVHCDPDVTSDGEIHWQGATLGTTVVEKDVPWAELVEQGYTKHD